MSVETEEYHSFLDGEFVESAWSGAEDVGLGALSGEDRLLTSTSFGSRNCSHDVKRHANNRRLREDLVPDGGSGSFHQGTHAQFRSQKETVERESQEKALSQVLSNINGLC